MDVDMRDGTRVSRSARRSANRRSAPYSREVNIKGSSAPTTVIVANLVKGTSPEDVRLTFEPLGRLVHVRHYSMPNLASNAVAFEVAFEQRSDALAACQKYDGVLADGRVLQVTMHVPPTVAGATGELPGAGAGTGGKSVSGPSRSRGSKRQSSAQKEAPAVSDRFEAEQLPLPILRRLAQAEAKYLAETERILRDKDAPAAATTSGKTPSLKDRLGSLPLAQRLAMTGPSGPQSAPENLSKSARRRRAKQRNRASATQASGGMDVEQA